MCSSDLIGGELTYKGLGVDGDAVASCKLAVTMRWLEADILDRVRPHDVAELTPTATDINDPRIGLEMPPQKLTNLTMSAAMQPMEAVRFCMATGIRRRVCHINKPALETLHYRSKHLSGRRFATAFVYRSRRGRKSLIECARPRSHLVHILQGRPPERHYGRMLRT